MILHRYITFPNLIVLIVRMAYYIIAEKDLAVLTASPVAAINFSDMQVLKHARYDVRWAFI